MFVFAAAVILLLLALAGSDLFVAQYSQDEQQQDGSSRAMTEDHPIP